jgi:hypothetical protein
MPIPRPGASRSIVPAALRGIVAVPSLVVLAGCLAGYAETVDYVWPADAQSHCLVDEGCQLGIEFLLVQPCPGDPL